MTIYKIKSEVYLDRQNECYKKIIVIFMNGPEHIFSYTLQYKPIQTAQNIHITVHFSVKFVKKLKK